MSQCVICGRPLKTGRKYCYVCRSLQHAKGIGEKRKKGFDIITMFSIVCGCICFFIASFYTMGDLGSIIRVFSILIGLPILAGLLIELSTRT